MAPDGDAQPTVLNSLKTKEDSLTPGSTYSMREPDYDNQPPPRFERFIDGFRRDPEATLLPRGPLGILDAGAHRVHEGLPYYDLRQATIETANPGLARKLHGRHLQMIAIGGSIGLAAQSISNVVDLRLVTSSDLVCSFRYWSLCGIW